MTFYILLFLITVGVLLCSKNKKFFMVAFALLWAVYALRDNVGVDDRNYILAFEYVKNGWSYDVEWSFLFLCKLALVLGMNYKFCFLVYATLSMVLLYRAVDIYWDTNFGKALFLACYFGTVFVSSLSVMRQFLSACFCFYAFALLSKEDKIAKPLTLCIVGTIVHMGAILSIPLLFFAKSKILISYSKKLLLVFVCLLCGYLNITNFLLKLVIQFLPSSYQIYSNSLSGSYSSAGGTLSLLLLLMYVIQCMMSKRAARGESIDPVACVLEKGQIMYLGLLFLFVNSGVASRLAFTFLPFSATIPITFLKRINRNQRRLVILILIVAMFLLMIMTLNSVSQAKEGAFIPYNASLDFWN